MRKTKPESESPFRDIPAVSAAAMTMHDALKGFPVLLENATILHAFPMGGDVAVVSVSSYKGKPGLDVRRCYLSDNNEWCPTAKGLRMPLEQTGAIAHALQRYADGAQ